MHTYTHTHTHTHMHTHTHTHLSSLGISVSRQDKVEGILASHGRVDSEEGVGRLLQTDGTAEVGILGSRIPGPRLEEEAPTINWAL